MTSASRPPTGFRAVLLAAMALGVLVAGQTRAVSPRINVDPSGFTLAEGAGTQVTATLDEPIICPPDPSLPCSVIVDFGPTVPPGISLSDSSIEWTPAQWAQSRTFTVSIADPGLLVNDQVFHLVAAANSRSEYYAGFSVDITVTVAVAETATTVRSTTSTAARRPATGSATGSTISAGAATSDVTSAAGTSDSTPITRPTPVDDPVDGPTAVPIGSILRWVAWPPIAGAALAIGRKLRRK